MPLSTTTATCSVACVGPWEALNSGASFTPVMLTPIFAVADKPTLSDTVNVYDSLASELKALIADALGVNV